VRKRRNADRSLSVRTAANAGAIGSALWPKATRRPVDWFAILAAGAASLIIIVNAVFLQSGSHPAPFFATPKPAQLAAGGPAEPAASIPARPAAATPVTPQAVAIRRDDPIATLIGPSPRVAAVQRVLSGYGYGQIKPTGIVDDATSAAIGKFEGEHKLPVTGQVSDRLVGALAAMVGHPLE
jgi:hypothetical protein